MVALIAKRSKKSLILNGLTVLVLLVGAVLLLKPPVLVVSNQSSCEIYDVEISNNLIVEEIGSLAPGDKYWFIVPSDVAYTEFFVSLRCGEQLYESKNYLGFPPDGIGTRYWSVVSITTGFEVEQRPFF